MSTTETRVKERPILFSGPMVRAILEGRKTQTRRVIKPQPEVMQNDSIGWEFAMEHFTVPCSEVFFCKNYCPYGSVGERLWVRETWVPKSSWDVEAGCLYKASEPDQYKDLPFKWKPSIHMPRLASRITLEVTGVRVERLNDISEADALAEGCEGNCQIGYIPAYQAGPCSYHFAQLWESINGPGSWALNPWVWVVEFKRINNL